MKTLEINYSSPSYWTFPFRIAGRHLQVAFASNSPASMERLLKERTISGLSKPELTLLGRTKHLVLGITEAVLSFALVGVILVAIDRYFFNPVRAVILDPPLQKAIQATPQFTGYGFASRSDTKLRNLSIRPLNLLLEALFGADPTTQPGTRHLYAFTKPLKEIRKLIFAKKRDEVIDVSAVGKKAQHISKGAVDLKDYLGDKTYSISAGEIQDMTLSQKAYVSPLIPKAFYLGMKEAFKRDQVVELPGREGALVTMEGLSTSPKHIGAFLQRVKANPARWGFVNNGTMLSFDQVRALTLYQVGAMILKTEDYRCLVGEGYKIKERKVGEKDAILLISASGIRGFAETRSIPGNEQHEIDFKIMKETFKASLKAAGKDAIIVFPAVGMGVWGGDPEIYWRAFLDAVVESGNDASSILINPNHQKTPYGRYSGCAGEEFAEILDSYADHPNLKKITNLASKKERSSPFSSKDERGKSR